MSDLFMGTLQGTFAERMVGCPVTNFADIVVAGERIESWLKLGKIQGNASSSGSKKPFGNGQRKKEGDTSAVYTQKGQSRDRYYQRTAAVTIPADNQQQQQQQPQQQRQPFQQRPQRTGYQVRGRMNDRQFDRPPVIYSFLLKKLKDLGLVQLRTLAPLRPDQRPASFDENAKCEFHSGAPGHNVENCKAFKHVVQDLVDSKAINFAPSPNVNANPMPAHGQMGVNAISEDGRRIGLLSVDQLNTPLAEIKRQLLKSGVFPGCNDCCAACTVAINGCVLLREAVQRLMDEGSLRFEKEDLGKEDVSTITIYFDPVDLSTLADAAPVTITVPGPIPYDKDDAVPWHYGGEVYCNGERLEDQTAGETTVSKVDNAGPSGFTRSGRADQSVGFFNPQQFLTTVLPQAVVSGHTLPSRVDSTRLHIPNGVDSPRLYLPSRSGCSLEFDARSIIPMPDPWFLSLKQNLGTVSVFAPPAESSLANRGCQNHCSFPQQQASNAILSPIRVSVWPEHRMASHLPTEFFALCISNSLARVQKMVIISPQIPLPRLGIEEVSDVQVDATCGIQASFPVSRPKWHLGQFSGIQTEVALRPIFRYPDRSGIQASFPVSRPKWHSGQCSDVQIEEVSDGQVDATCGIQASIEVAFRPSLSDVQIEEVSDVQVDATCGIQANFPMFRSKSFPVFRLMSGIQAMVISVLPFILRKTDLELHWESLLLSSEGHREALLKILKRAYVPQEITINQLETVVSNVNASHGLGFTDMDLTVDERNHNRALHIAMECKGVVLSHVLVDTGSSLNVLPKKALAKLNCEGLILTPTDLIVRAFDGSKRAVFGEVELPVKIGPEVFKSVFYVMDIQPAYSCLLGCPWIHAAGAVTSTLHQKLKYIWDGQVVTVCGEEDIFVSHLSSFKYVEMDGEIWETPSQAFETVKVENALFAKEEEKPSISSYKQAAEVVKSGEAPGWGKMMDIAAKKDRFGVGYQPGRGSSGQGRGCRPSFTFTSAGMLDPDNICMVGEEVDSDCEIDQWIKSCVPGMEVQNWKAEKIIIVTLLEECDISPDLIDNNPVTPSYDFDNPIYHAEEEGEEDCELPEELARLLKQEEKVIQPHEEQLEDLDRRQCLGPLVAFYFEIHVLCFVFISPHLARFLRQGLPVCPRASQTLKPKATRLLLLLQANEIRRHKTRCLSEHTSPQPIGQPSYEDSDSHIQMRYHKINPHPLDKNYKSGSRRVLRMRRGANTFPSHNRLPNPRFGCETPSCPFLFQVATAGDSAGESVSLSESLLAFVVCLFIGCSCFCTVIYLPALPYCIVYISLLYLLAGYGCLVIFVR
ncbi:hypothetical protein KIW84_055810 [Lathyrus oleraceus]|uniref:Uncharacterized protein n=1 Tax=Pisum sativum TaxID=3888 RepID=A0A9D4WXP5_PEA|nr:hypothetical protein KIW84_055810 [Pisum sativum]